jgi:hypothetical protein
VPTGHWAFNPNAPSYRTPDIDKAKSLLAKAGLPDGFSMKMKFITSRGEYTPIAQLMQASWEKIGVHIELLPMQIGEWAADVYDKIDFDMAMDGGLPQWDPHYLFTQTYLGDEQKATGWKNDEFEKLLKDGVATLDQEKRKQIYWRAHEIVQTELPMTVIGHRFIIMAARNSCRCCCWCRRPCSSSSASCQATSSPCAWGSTPTRTRSLRCATPGGWTVRCTCSTSSGWARCCAVTWACPPTTSSRCLAPG